MAIIFQKTILSSFCIYFVVFGNHIAEDYAVTPNNINVLKTSKKDFGVALNLIENNQPKECDCGNLGTCSYKDSRKVCNCFDGAKEFNGTCQECDCGLGKCSFTEYGKKTCRCAKNTFIKNGKCEKCDCGKGICRFIEDQKICECQPKYSVLNGTCEVCDCGVGNCSFIESQKFCDCPTNFSELKGKCEVCDCGVGICSFIDGQRYCDCPTNFSVLRGKCEVCDCGVGNCSFLSDQKICDCPEKFHNIKGKCEVCDCGVGNCSFIDDQKTCDCPSNFSDRNGKCYYISDCIKMHLNGDCLNPHEMCQDGICSCERDYIYMDNKTCVRKNMCTNEEGKKTCSELSAICVEDSTDKKGFKCICDDGFSEDKLRGGKCVHKCTFERENKKCLDSLSVCELDSDYNTKCNCPPIYKRGQTEKCDKMAEYSFIGMFQVLKKPYKVFSSQYMSTSFIDYIKLARDFNDSFTSVFRLYQDSKILNCKENSADLDCSVELQFKKGPGEELNIIFTPSVCLPMSNSKYCIIPPHLILKKNNNKVFRKTTPCDEVISNSLCGPSTICQLLENNEGFQCKCKQGFVPTSAYNPFPDYSESVIQKCKDINECLDKNACPESTNCVNRIGSYDCFCKDGFHQKASLDIKIDGCVEICNPNPCIHGICNFTSTNGFLCNCEPSFTGFRCDEPNLLITDIQEASRNRSFIIGGTLGFLLVIATIVCVNLLRKIKVKSMEEEENCTFKSHRKRYIRKQPKRSEVRNDEDNVENTTNESNIYQDAEINKDENMSPNFKNDLEERKVGERSIQEHTNNGTFTASEYADNRRKSSYQQDYSSDKRRDRSKNSKGKNLKGCNQNHIEINQKHQNYDHQRYIKDNVINRQGKYSNDELNFNEVHQREIRDAIQGDDSNSRQNHGKIDKRSYNWFYENEGREESQNFQTSSLFGYKNDGGYSIDYGSRNDDGRSNYDNVWYFPSSFDEEHHKINRKSKDQELRRYRKNRRSVATDQGHEYIANDIRSSSYYKDGIAVESKQNLHRFPVDENYDVDSRLKKGSYEDYEQLSIKKVIGKAISNKDDQQQDEKKLRRVINKGFEECSTNESQSNPLATPVDQPHTNKRRSSKVTYKNKVYEEIML